MYYFFLDASALGKRYVPELGTPLVNHLFQSVSKERMVALVIVLGEVVSILVRRRNAGQISNAAYRQAIVEFHNEVVSDTGIPLQSVSDDSVLASLTLIEQHSLNATDTIILDCALQLSRSLQEGGDDLALVTSDNRMATAAAASGLTVWNPEKDDQTSLDKLIS